MESVDKQGGGDGRGFALEEAEGVGLVGMDAALGVEAEGELLHNMREVDAVFFLPLFKKMAVVGNTDEFWDKKPDCAGYALRAATKERWGAS